MNTFNKLVDMSITGGLFVLTFLAYFQGLFFGLLIVGIVSALLFGGSRPA